MNVIHELVFTDREARPAKWQTRCGRTDVPVEHTMTPTPRSHYSVTCAACLAAAPERTAFEECAAMGEAEVAAARAAGNGKVPPMTPEQAREWTAALAPTVETAEAKDDAA